MSKIVEWFLLPLFFVLSVIYAFNSLCDDSVELKKVYYHATKNDIYLEKGNLSLYFSVQPHVKKMNENSFFFPCAIKNEECEAMMQRVNNHNAEHGVTVEKVVMPNSGILITFAYDPNKVALSYELFDSIGMQKGVVFRLYNRDVINALQHKSDQPILRMLSTKKPYIAIDCGHGGSDSGAIGNGEVVEKAVCLAIGKDVAQFLQHYGYTVVLTRTEDVDFLLDERTAYANEHQVDLFVSIHANHASNVQVRGIETFCIQPHLFKEHFSTLSYGEKKIIAQYGNKKSDISHKIAESIQRYLCCNNYIHEQISHKAVDRKVKFSVSQVLLGTQMPSVLVEVGFLSHPEEVVLLNNERYQKFLAQRIVDGIIAVIPS